MQCSPKNYTGKAYLCCYLKMKMKVMEGWPTTIIFSLVSIFPSSFLVFLSVPFLSFFLVRPSAFSYLRLYAFWFSILCLFFLFFFFLGFTYNSLLPCAYALRFVFIVQESHDVWEIKSQINSFSSLKFKFD